MKLQCEIETLGGNVTEIELVGSAGATKLSIDDNSDALVNVSYAGSFDEDNWRWLTPEFMRDWLASGKDLRLRVDGLRMHNNIKHVISAIELDVDDFSISTNNVEQMPYYEVNATTIDEHMLKVAVEENAFKLSCAAEDNAGWPVVYYRAKTIANIDVLNAFELKAIQGTDAVRKIKAFFTHNKLLSTLEFDQFGLKYNDITNLHFLAETFHKTYNDIYARPAIRDIIYVEFLDQYFEVTDVEDVKTATNKVLYYDVKLQFITDRASVAKDSDILDLTNLINAESQVDMQDFKHAPKTTTEVDERIWSKQILKTVEAYTTEQTDNYVYGICYDNDLQWCKFAIHDDNIDYYALTDNEYNALRTDVVGNDLQVAKLAMFDKELSKFDKTMYYTSYIFPRTLQPLQLIEHQSIKQ